jgi:hypothetical protein
VVPLFKNSPNGLLAGIYQNLVKKAKLYYRKEGICRLPKRNVAF